MLNIIEVLSTRELSNLCRECNLSVPTELRNNKQMLSDYIRANGSPILLAKLTDLKRKRDEEKYACHVRIRLTDKFSVPKSQAEYDASRYLDLPTVPERKTCYQQFYEATSNIAVTSGICCVCGRWLLQVEEEMIEEDLLFVPHLYRLIPHQSHPSHNLYNGALLEPHGIRIGENGVCQVTIC